MAVGVAEGRDGTPITLIATSENTSGGLYLRPGITLKPNEMMVSGTGHAEKRIVDFCRNQRLRLLSIGATRDVCKDICAPAIIPTGADIVTPISEKQLRRRD